MYTCSSNCIFLELQISFTVPFCRVNKNSSKNLIVFFLSQPLGVINRSSKIDSSQPELGCIFSCMYGLDQEDAVGWEGEMRNLSFMDALTKEKYWESKSQVSHILSKLAYHSVDLFAFSKIIASHCRCSFNYYWLLVRNTFIIRILLYNILDH